MTSKDILLERRGHVAVIRLNRPDKLNAMTVDMDRAMNDFVFTINNDATIRAVVLTANGERAFCAGSDITDLDEYGANWEYRNRFDARMDYARAIHLIRKPIVAALFGYVIGGGLEMACASDIRLATPDAQFGAGEINWGWHGGSGQTQYLTRIMGPGNAARLLLTGERFDADFALRTGLIQEIHPREDLEASALALAENIASKSPIAIQMTKHMIRVAQNTSLDVGLMVENDSFSYCMTTEDSTEGQKAFAEKRPPNFQGK
jgi:enoyl-CoA hydratase|tara:strand:- start:1154 stop:1939 length:786 start_codon:yes stop_codon:yes gene_type:complete